MDRRKDNLILEGISKMTPAEDKPQTASAKAESVNFLQFVMGAYGDAKRKGIDKLAFNHVLDVVDNLELEEIDDVGRSIRLYKVGMLHDMIEDQEIKPEKLAQMLHLIDEEFTILSCYPVMWRMMISLPI